VYTFDTELLNMNMHCGSLWVFSLLSRQPSLSELHSEYRSPSQRILIAGTIMHDSMSGREQLEQRARTHVNIDKGLNTLHSLLAQDRIFEDYKYSM